MNLLLALVLLTQQDAKQEFEAKRAELRGSKDAGAHVDLGNWCLEKNLKDSASWCFKKAHEIEKDHPGAREGMRKLGYDLENNVWRLAKEIYEKKRRTTVELDARFELAKYARDFGLEKEWKRDCEALIKIEPDYRPAREALGYASYHGEWLTPAELAVEEKLDEVWAAALKKTPAEAHTELKAAGYKGTLEDVKRVFQFAASPDGTHKDVKLALDADKYPGEYTYGIPKSYQPWHKNPLIVFLHGGGEGVGDGDDYFPQIWPHSSPAGYVTVCPTVLEKIGLAWNNERHVNYVRTIVKEMQSKYNIDPRRMYLMGHSMGGFGCFYIGTRTTDLFAAISPWSGGPNGWVPNNLKYTPAYIIHGNKDPQVRVEGSREADRQLTQLKYYHVYVELSIEGHGVPQDEQKKAVAWLERFKLSPLAGQKK